MKMKMEMKNRSHKCAINRTGSNHGHKYSKYKVSQDDVYKQNRG